MIKQIFGVCLVSIIGEHHVDTVGLGFNSAYDFYVKAAQ